MKILENIEQGSAVWLELRKSKITGTDSSILTGSNKWKTKLELWEQKLGIREPDICTEKMKRGSELEEPARLLLNEALEIDFKPAVVISSGHPYMMASLDGLSPCRRFMCEIKCPNIKNHEAAIEGIIAEYYHDQMQHCLAVTGCEKCYYCSYHPDHIQKIAIIEVICNFTKQAEIIGKAYEFFMQLNNFDPPREWKLNKKDK